MLIRRFVSHIRSQDWSAVFLELVIVFLGIFAAFQVDRWNDERILRGVEADHLVALAVDFAANRQSLQSVIDIHKESVDAAATLLAYQPDIQEDISHDDFYDLMRVFQYMGSWEPQRRAYDVLIASGEIGVIADDELKTNLAAYFAATARADDRRNELSMQRVTSWEPYIVENLDHVAMVMKVHPEISETLSPSLPQDQFWSVLGTAEFEGQIVTKMHASHDATSYYGQILELNAEIENRLVQLIDK